MKNIMSTLFAILLCSTILVAQERGDRQQRSPEDRAKAEVERLNTALKLTKAQQDSILNYMLQNVPQQRQSMQNKDEDREAAMKKMRAQWEAREAKIKSYLTKEQIEKYDALQKERMNNRPQRQRNN